MNTFYASIATCPFNSAERLWDPGLDYGPIDRLAPRKLPVALWHVTADFCEVDRCAHVYLDCFAGRTLH